MIAISCVQASIPHCSFITIVLIIVVMVMIEITFSTRSPIHCHLSFCSSASFAPLHLIRWPSRFFTIHCAHHCTHQCSYSRIRNEAALGTLADHLIITSSSSWSDNHRSITPLYPFLTMRSSLHHRHDRSITLLHPISLISSSLHRRIQYLYLVHHRPTSLIWADCLTGINHLKQAIHVTFCDTLFTI